MSPFTAKQTIMISVFNIALFPDGLSKYHGNQLDSSGKILSWCLKVKDNSFQITQK